MQKLTMKRKENILILLLAGVLLMVISIPTEHTDKTEAVHTEYQTTEEVAVPISKEEVLESRLESILCTVRGIGKVEVMITLKTNGKQLVEKDERSSLTDERGGNTQAELVAQREMEESTVYKKMSDGSEIPFIREETEPEIEGVLVAAQIENDGNIITEITEAAMALFDIEAHKIKVMKME